MKIGRIEIKLLPKPEPEKTELENWIVHFSSIIGLKKGWTSPLTRLVSRNEKAIKKLTKETEDWTDGFVSKVHQLESAHSLMKNDFVKMSPLLEGIRNIAIHNDLDQTKNSDRLEKRIKALESAVALLHEIIAKLTKK